MVQLHRRSHRVCESHCEAHSQNKRGVCSVQDAKATSLPSWNGFYVNLPEDTGRARENTDEPKNQLSTSYKKIGIRQSVEAGGVEMLLPPIKTN